MTGEPPLLACSECGVLVMRTVGFGACVECMTVEVRATIKEGE